MTTRSHKLPIKYVECPKCRAVSGNDWRQCAGNCPMPMSPHYEKNHHDPGDEDGTR